MSIFSKPEPKNSTQVPPVYAAEDLTRHGPTATICLNDQIYVLRITKSGKLILTK